MLTARPTKSRFLACLAAGALSLSAMGNSLAGTCGCQTECQTCPPPAASCGCNQCECAPKKQNCLQKHFSKFASHFKNMLKPKKGCDSMCDDGCDAAMIEELMVPAPTSSHHHHNHHPQRVPTPPAGEFEAITPPEPAPLANPGPSDVKMSSPRIEVSPTKEGEQPKLMPPPVRKPQTTKPSEEGGLFDSLSDPFDDDQTRRNLYQHVRPSAYEQDDLGLRPIGQRPLSRSQSTSSRRSHSRR